MNFAPLSAQTVPVKPVPVKTDTSVKVTIKLTDVNFKYLIDSFNSIKARYVLLKSQIPPKGSPIMAWVWWIFIILCAIYQLIVTIIPTSRNIGLVHVVENIFGAIAKLFNGIGNAAKLPDGSVGKIKSLPTNIAPTVIAGK
ncbi:MAG: hypothetical protein PHW73_01070 [Atribacterota bacterium]|nr:hypothetical protein [Atribacterota bacterium]